MGLCGPEDRRAAPEFGGALLQPGAPAFAPRRVGGEAAGLLPGGLPDGTADQPGRHRGAVSLRDLVLVLQLPLVQSGAGLRPRVLVAGTAQGQDPEGADGPGRIV